MHRLEQMKETLMNCVQTEINGHLDTADAKELGEAIDMIKDLSEAIYYCTITKAMEDSDEDDEKPRHKKHHKKHYDDYYEEDIDREFGKRYYGNGMPDYNNMYDEGFRPLSNPDRRAINYPNGNMMKNREEIDRKMKDEREGKSPERRRKYMEGKEMHHDKEKQMKELEDYMQELTQDIVEMIQDASPEEKQILQQKLNVLAAKVR